MNSIVFDDDLVNEDEADSVTLSGQVEVGSTVNSIVISDGNPANDVTVPAAAITVDAETGAVTVTGQDLSGLADGTLTVTMNVTDEAGNTGDVTDETILDTTAASQDDGLNSIVFDDDLVNEDEADSVTLSGQVEVGSTVNSIVISDGNPANDVTVPAAAITVDAETGAVTVTGQDLSGLADGTLTVTMNVTDEAGNTGDVTDETILDTTAASQDDGLNSIVFDDDLVNEDEADSVTLSGQVEVGSTVNSIVISDGNPANDVTVPAAAITVDAETGAVTVTGQDLSGLADGTLTVTMNVTDEAGNTGDVTDETILDTTAASQDDGLNSIVFDDDLVNEDEADSVTLSGQVEVGSTVNSIVISDGNPANDVTVPAAAITVDAETGAVTVTGQDLSGLADGTLTVTMNVTDEAGNTGDVTDETILDTTAASQDDGLNSIVFDDDLVNEDEADSVTLSGQVEVGSTVNSIVISDGNPANDVTVPAAAITVDAETGAVTVTGQDLSGLADGTLTVTMNVTDEAGNTGDVTDETILDTTAASQDDGLNSIVFDDDLVNEDEADSVTLSGQVEVGSTVNSIVISDGNPANDVTVPAAAITVDAETGAVTVTGQDLSGLADGTLTVTMNVTDEAGNTGDVTDETILDTTAASQDDGLNSIVFDDDLVNEDEADSVTLSGQVEVGSTVNSIVISDGNPANDVTVPAAAITVDAETGAVTVTGQDLSGLADGTLTVTMNVTDEAGNTGDVTDETILDTTAASQDDGLNSIVFDDDLVNEDEADSVTLSGQVEVGSTVNSIVISDGNPANDVTVPAAAITVDAETGAVTVTGQDLSGLADGTLTVTMNVTDEAGNTGDVTDETILDTTAASQDDGLNSIVFDDDLVNEDEADSVTLSGQVEVGSTVNSIVISDGNPANDVTVPAAAITVDAETGAVTVTGQDLSGLADGTLTVTMNVTDEAGNTGDVTDETILDTTAASQDDGLNSIVFDDDLVNEDEADSVTLSGQVEVGSTVNSIVISDGNPANDVTVPAAAITVDAETGAVTVTGQDLSGLADGTLTVTMNVTDEAGNTGDVTDETILDTTAASQDDGLNSIVFDDDLVNEDEADSVTLSGQVEVGSTVNSIVISDGNPANDVTVPAAAITVDAETGAVTVTGQDLSGLADGTLTVTMNVTDEAGNTGDVTDETILDTTAASQDDGLNSIVFDDDLVNEDEADSVTLSGQVEVGSTVNSIVISDGNPANDVTVPAAAITVDAETGAVTVTGQDLSGLADGTLTVTMNVTDEAGNTGDVTDETILDTTAASQDDGLNSIVFDDDLVNEDEADSVTLSGQVEVGSTVNSIVISDGNPANDVTVPAAAITVDAETGAVTVTGQDLSGLADGTLTVTMNVTDEAGNTGDVTDETILDTTAASQDDGLNSIVFDDDLVNEDEADSVTLSGQVEVGSTVNSIVISDGNPANDVTVPAAAITVDAETGAVTVTGQDLSGLADGTLTVTMNVTDEAGNTGDVTDETILDTTAASQDDGLNSIVFDDDLVNEDEADSVTLSGQVEVGSTVNSIVISDGNPANDVTVPAAAITVDAETGAVTVTGQDLSGLADGTLTVTMNVTDEAGNTGDVTDETILDTTAASQDDGLNSIVFDDDLVNEDEADSVTLSGQVEVGSTVNSIVISDGNPANDVTVPAAAITVDAETGAVTVTGQDLSGLADGTLTVTMNVTDEAGNTGDVTDETILDTTAASQDDGLNSIVFDDDLVNEDEADSVTLSGQVEVGSTVNSIVISDGNPANDVTVPAAAITVDAETGAVTVTGQDLSGLADGTLTVTMNVTDEAGNTGDVTDETILDTTAASQDDGLNSIVFDDDLVNEDEADSVTLSGQVEVGSTVNSIVISDGNPANDVTVPAAAITVDAETGAVTVTGQDLSGLADGTLTVTMNVTDEAGNTGDVTDETILDTTAASQDDGLNSIVFDDDLVNEDEADSVTLSGQVEVGSTVNSIVISDGNPANDVTVPAAAITVDAETGAVTVTGQDLSGLADGTLTVTMNVTDEAGNTGDVTDETILDTTAASQDDGLNSIVFDDDLVNEDEADSVTLSGQVEVGSTVNSIVISDGNPANDVTVPAAAITVDAETGAVTVTGQDLSGLADGTLTVTMNVTDEAGNTGDVTDETILDTTAASQDDGLNSIVFDDDLVNEDEADSVTLSGQVEVGSTVNSIVISDGNPANDVTVPAAAITVDAETGAVTVTGQDLSGLADGTLTVTMNVTDEAGNTGDVTDETILDTTAASQDDGLNSIVFDDDLVNEDEADSVTLSGQVEVGSTVNSIVISDGNPANDVTVPAAAITVDAETGAVTVTGQDLSGLADGTLTVTMNVTDEAGNTGDVTDETILDTTAASQDDGLNSIVFDDDLVNEDEADSVTLSGQVEVGSTVNSIVISDGNPANDVTVPAAAITVDAETGAVTVTGQDLSGLADGTLTVTMNVTDEAGNTGDVTDETILDTTAASQDDGLNSIVFDDDLVNEDEADSVTLSGQVEVGSTVNSIVISDGNPANDVTVPAAAITVDAETGAVTVTGQDLSGLADGTLTVTMNVTDEAGNTGDVTDETILDTTAASQDDGLNSIVFDDDLVNEDEADSVTLSGQVEVGSTVNSIVISDGNPANDVTVPAAAITVDAETGAVTVTGQDLSGLADGTLTVTMNVTDEAGNTGDVTDETILDTTAASQDDGLNSIVFDDDLVNEDEADSVTLSGQVEVGSTVNSIVISDGNPANDVTVPAAAITVDAETGAVTVTGQDLSGLADGTLTVTMNVTDEAGNTGDVTDETILDTTAASQDDGLNSIVFDDDLVNEDEADSVTLSGQVEVGSTVNSIVISDGNPANDVTVPAAAITVDAETGAVTVTGQDLSGLADGTLTVTMNVTDEAGNTGDVTDETILDTTAASQDDGLNSIVFDDDLVNEDEADSVTLSGQVEVGSTVNSIVISDGNPANDVTVPAAAITVDAETGAVTVTGQDLSGLADGTLTVTMNVTDEAGNTGDVTDETILDTTAASQDDGLNSIVFDDDLVNEDEADSVTLSGQVEVGSTVNSIVISDGNPANDVTVPAAAITVDAETGAVTVTGQDLSGLADGTLTVTMNVTDEAGNTGDVTDETILDTTAASQDDGLNSIVFDDDLVNEDEADSVTLSGQVEVGSTVNSIVISDGNPANDVTVPAAAITVDAETGAVTVTGQDLSGLADGTLTVTMNVTDEAGNTGDVTDETILDTTAASQDDGLNSIVFDDDLVNEDEADSVTLSGQVEVGSTVNSIVISDGNPANDVTVPAAAITVDAETGAVTVTGQDLSGLADGTLTVTMNVTDEAGNTGDVTDETILDTTAASQDDGLNSIVFDDDLVNEDEADSVTLSGQVEVGSTVNSIVISDGNPANDVTVPAAAITVDAETGAVTVTGQDLSGLADGTLTVTMNVTDEAGNTGDVTDETILDTTAASQDDGLNSIVFDDDLVNEDEADSVTLSGQVEVGSTVNSIVISDGNPANDVTVPAAAITVDAETGAVTVTGQDLSGLADGTLTVTMNVTDEAGNTGDVTDETILDTTAASQDDGLNSIVFDDDLVNEDEADSVTLSGQVEVGSTVNSIVISDGNPANDVTVPAAAITVDAETGAVTVTGQDLSGLADGTLTVTMNVTDEAGNTGDVTDETILDTTAASQDDGLNSIVFDDDLVNEDEADSVTLSGQVEVGSTVNSIVISDGNPANDVTVPAAAITVDAETGAVTVTGQDLSGLADGTLTVTMNVTDEAGNTGDVTDETILDTTAASQDDGLNSIVFDDDLVNEDEADSVTLSGQVEVGSTVNSIVISDGNPANDVTVPAAAITVDAETGAVTVTGQDLSGLADGTLTVTMNVTDEAGNTGDVTDETILRYDGGKPR
ncbi:hypothetical protein AB6D16_006365 [Vibrio cyclitrophicus]